MSEADHWSGNRGRGSRWLIRVMVRIALRAGPVVAGAVLHGITAYFLVFAPHQRRCSAAYLQRALGRPARLKDVYRHIWTFAATLLDRVYLLAGKTDGFDIKVRHVDSEVGESLGRPCMVVSAHLGSFELLRCMAADNPEIEVRPLMYREQRQAIDGVLRELNPELSDRIIEIGRFDSLLAAREAIERGESLAVLADRCPPGGVGTEATLLGGSVRLPEGPFQLAYALGVPIVLCFGLRRGSRRYEVFVEGFADVVRVPRGPERKRVIGAWVQAFAGRLERYCRDAPFNWFNFYDYWGDLAPVRRRDAARDGAVHGRERR